MQSNNGKDGGAVHSAEVVGDEPVVSLDAARGRPVDLRTEQAYYRKLSKRL